MPAGKRQATGKDTKRKLNRGGMAEDENPNGPKPGLETSFPHIAQMFIGRQDEIAIEVSRCLRPHLARRLGVRRRPAAKR